MNTDHLRLEIEASRRAIQRDYASLRAELNFVAKAKRAIATHPLPWLSGSAFFGFLLSRRRKQKIKKAGKMVEPIQKISILNLMLTVGRLLLPIVQSRLTSLILGKFAKFTGQFQHGSNELLRDKENRT